MFSLKAFIDEVVKIGGVDFNSMRNAYPHGGNRVRMDPKASGGSYDSTTHDITLEDENPNSLAHEMGHAKSRESKLIRAIDNPLTRGAFFASPLVSAGMALHKRTRPYAYLPALTSIPTAIGEVGASIEGSKIMREHGATEEEMSEYKKRMGKALLSYGQVPALALGAAAGIRALTQK